MNTPGVRPAVVVALAIAGAAPVAYRLASHLPSRLAEVGSTNLATLVLVQTAVAASGVLPASLVAIAMGASLGMMRGFVVCAAGTMVGGIVAFLLARSFLRPWVARWIGRRPAFARLDEAVAAGNWKIACLIRLSPIMPFAAASYGLGLTRISTTHFFVGMAASIPALFGYVALGAIGRAGISGGTDFATGFSTATMVVGAAASLLLVAYLRRLIGRHGSPEQAATLNG